MIFDHSSKTFRNELYPLYKANRSAPPEDLVPQFGLIRQATRAFDLPCIEMEGFEPDDLIATMPGSPASRRRHHHQSRRQGPDAARGTSRSPITPR